MACREAMSPDAGCSVYVSGKFARGLKTSQVTWVSKNWSSQASPASSSAGRKGPREETLVAAAMEKGPPGEGARKKNKKQD